MEFLIFSDESGCWNAGKYYIRAWVKISPVQYCLLRKEVIFAKHETGIKELKWGHVSRSYNKYKDIFSPAFNVFITISIPGHYQKRLLEDKYKIIKTLKDIGAYQSTGGERLTQIVKNKIICSAQHTLFLNYFEKQHMQNAKGALVEACIDNDYNFVIDTPQCLDRDWRDIAHECGINNVDIIKDSDKNPGIELADIICGCVHNYLKHNVTAAEVYKKSIKSKMSDMTSTSFPNPNLVFYNDFSETEKNALNIFR